MKSWKSPCCRVWSRSASATSPPTSTTSRASGPVSAAGKVGLAATSRNRRLTPLRLLFARMQRHRLIALNPLDDIRAARTSAHRSTLWLTRQQARALEDACAGDSLRDLRDRALIVLMLATGLRASETLSLAVADLTSAEGHRIAWVTGKGGARERVKLAPKADRALRAWLDASGIADGALFRRLYRLKTVPRRIRRRPTASTRVPWPIPASNSSCKSASPRRGSPRSSHRTVCATPSSRWRCAAAHPSPACRPPRATNRRRRRCATPTSRMSLTIMPSIT
ncbi:MAG: tyrosine-type recombinase/integrase [Thermomicrobiales bacterium]